MSSLNSANTIGYILSVVLLLSVTVDQLAIKMCIGYLGKKNIVYRGMFTTPAMFLLSLFTFHFDVRCILFLPFYCGLEYVNMVLCNISLNKLPLSVYGVLVNSTPLFSLLFAVLLGTEPVTFMSVVAVMLYSFGVLVVSPSLTGNMESSGILYAVVASIVRSLKLLLLQYLLYSELISNELLLFIGIAVTNVLVYLRNRSDINFNVDILQSPNHKQLLQLLLLQMLCALIGNTAHGRAIHAIGVLPVSIILAMNLITQMFLLSRLNLESIKRHHIAGTLFVVMSVLLSLLR